jgi:hypothetical protein
MFVSVTRDHLRDELIMVDPTFALSPISARAAQPREEDYDAISEAFMETSRGRWFLGEYARRNRNADTGMVLDAVARIEQTLAAQRQSNAESTLAEALVAIGAALDEARASATAALNGLALEETLAPVRKGARVMREIAWRWREIGADGRICDLIDSQVGAIEAACGQIVSMNPKAQVGAAFDRIGERIEQFGGGNTATLQPAEPTIASAVPAPDAMPAVVSEAEQATATDAEAAIDTAVQVEPAVAAAVANATAEAAEATAETAEATAEAAEAAAETAEATAEAAEEAMANVAEATAEAAETEAEAADAYDDAVLDRVALEMAAPEPADAYADADADVDSDSDEIHVTESRPADPETILPPPEPAQSPSLQPSLQPSLGSSLIANGIVRRPSPPESDPLAPIRRTSQVEKIALFS